MDLSKIPLLTGLAARLDFLAARTSVIAQNIANADTPDYVSQDITAPDFKAMANAASEMRVNDPRHIGAASGARTGGYDRHRAPDGEASLTGNQVSIENQAMKLSQTRQEYALAASIYRKGLSMLRIAARGQ